MTDQEQMRRDFEAAAGRAGYSTEKYRSDIRGGTYLQDGVRCAWDIWQEAALGDRHNHIGDGAELVVWQPIETMPESVTVLLAVDGMVYTGRKLDRDDGTVWTIGNTSTHSELMKKLSLPLPTNWMPLPQYPNATLTHEGAMGQAVDSPATTNSVKISSEPAAYMLKLARPSMIPAEWLQPMVDQGRTKADKWAPLYTAEAIHAAKVEVLEQVRQTLKNATGEYIISYDELTHSFWSQSLEDLANKIRGSAPD